MFEKYDEQARRALFFARSEAHRLGSLAIGAEHLLLGVLREGERAVEELFRHFGVRPERLRREIESERESAGRLSATPELPLTEESKQALVWATHEAERMRHHLVGGAHVVIGILRVEECLAARLLRQHGLDIDSVREQVGRRTPMDRILSGPY